jgi:hypothetical protein
MIDTLTTSDIAHRLHKDEYSSFTIDGAFALAEYLEELEESIGQQIEFDPITIRCDFTEYDSLFDWASQYYGDDLATSEEEFSEDWARNEIQDNGTLIEFDGGIIVSSF